MKIITLTSIIIFVIVTEVIYFRSITSQKNQIIPDQTQTSNNLENSYINNSQKGKINHINPPNINVNNLEFSLMNSMPDSFTMNEVSKHNSSSSCFLIINNKVYDVSSYLIYHPAGSKTITSRCGKEVTGIFARIHSNRAWDLLKKYKIGTITTNKPDTTFQVLTAVSAALKEANPNAKIIKVRPKTNFYVAKIIYSGKLYEIHLDNNGQILKEEVEDDESNWSLWEDDNDDQ